MKRFLLTIFFLLLFTKQTFASTLYPENQNAVTPPIETTNERIKDFKSDILIQKDGSIEVRETIKYYFDTYRHGIFRNIPFTKYDKGKRYDVAFTFKPVVDENGKSYKVSKTTEGEQYVLKIGDPERTFTGDHTYIISYTARGELGYFSDHNELYWNVTGNRWDVPIENSETTITLPENTTNKKVKLDCFTGGYKETAHSCTGESDGQTTTIKTTSPLNPNEGLTVVVGFPKGMVGVLKPTEYIPFFERWYGKIVLVFLVILAICWYIALPVWLIIHWYRTGRDPDVGIPLAAGFDPPKAGKRFLTPAETGTLIDETVQNRDIFASIVDLARRGYIRIEEPSKKDFWLKRINAHIKVDTLQPFEYKLLNGIFLSDDFIQLKKTPIYETISNVKTLLYNDMVSLGYFKTNPNTTRSLYYVLGAVALFTANFVLAFVAFVFGRVMPRKTLVGAQQASVAKSLKNFLTSQERQLEFQADKQMMFEKLLPFAVAFGVEKIWAKRFEEFKLKQPDWYQGYPGSTFNSVYLASSLSNSFSSFSVASTPPSSSSSGFGGGGFSGGGGGGGGGGSW